MSTTIPGQILQYIDGDNGNTIKLLKCKGCGSIPSHCEAVEIGGCPSFISLSCTSTLCKSGTWFLCCACSQVFARWGKAERHVNTKKHNDLAHRYKESKASANNVSLTPSSISNQDAFDSPSSNFFPLAESQESMISLLDFGPYASASVTNDESWGPGLDHEGSCLATATGTPNAGIVQENCKNDSEEAAAVSNGTVAALARQHEWLADVLKDTPKASQVEVFNSLECSPNMQRFWQAEHISPGGGLVYLVGRAFNRSNFVGSHNLPDFPEAKWQMQNFMQYVNMSERQRDWQAQITMDITSSGSELIKKTRIPNALELKKFYLSDCQHCLWESLPIPTIRNINGIAYVNPEEIIRFAFAAGLQFDDIVVSKDTDTGKGPGKQYHVGDSKKMKELMRNLQNAQDQNGDYKIVVAWCSDWRDGFGVNRTKNNRKSVVAWTFSVSPGKEVVNSVGNTFAMALGQKKNSGWSLVEHQVRQDTSVFCDPTKPLHVYHGGLRKMVQVYVVRINTSHDKPERADVTGTLSYNGNTHRSFGRLIHVVTPPCDSTRVKEFLASANPNQSNKLANSLEWGWSDTMLSDEGDAISLRPNGAILPACRLCRAKNLHILLHSFPDANREIATDDVIRNNNGVCDRCANWTMDATTARKLPFKAPADYPTTCAPNSPVEPPPGRCTSEASLTSVTCPESGKTEHYLYLKELEFPNMVKACKFAFFNLVSDDKPWTVGQGKAYLTANGISPKHGSKLCIIAKDAKKNGRARDVNYNDPEGIDNFRFPAAWIDPNLQISDYIETVMHELFLGIAESNFELCSLWNKSGNRDTAFRRNSQDLLLELKKFGLNWLHSYQFSESDDPKSGTYGTGAWQSENWIAWIRISKIVYLHASVPRTVNNPRTTGNGDVFRLVIVFTALAARVMSHSGIDDSDIQEFICLLREFFSCVRELDIQTRHADMKKKTKKAQDSPGEVPAAPTGKVFGNSGPQELGAQDRVGGADVGITITKPIARKKKRPKALSGSTVARKKKKSSICESGSDSDYVDEDNPPQKTRGKTWKAPPRKQARQPINKDTTAELEEINHNGPSKAKKKRRGKSKEKTTSPSTQTTGGGEAWWTRANYLSLPNLVQMMEIFGLLINFWDGGGKGEKFVQEVKPLISRGVQEYATFFVVIMEKLYKHRLLDIFREMYSLFAAGDTGLMDFEQLRFSIGLDGEIVDNQPNIDINGIGGVPSTLPATLPDGVTEDYSPMEDVNMSKFKTFYCYRSEESIEGALDENLPVSGILVHNETDRSKLDFYVLYKSKKKYGWKKIIFHDHDGVFVGGLWYAPMERTGPTQVVPDDFEGIQTLAKMSTVAIPMRYGIGAGSHDSNKYCVITNWWKERQKDGRYTKPPLDPAYYKRHDNYESILEVFEDQTGNII